MTDPATSDHLNGLLRERLYCAGINNPNVSFTCQTQYCSACQHHIVSEDVTRGLQINGMMSSVRRFFCLFITFDFLFTSLLWLICLVLAGDFNFTTAFYKEIVHYSIKTSLFDVVMASFSRFVVLLLFYGLFKLDHWIIVATTTVGTCCFSVEKVYIFDWSTSQQVLSVMLIISSFTLSWAEVWLLDSKVIPQERSAIQYITGVTNSDERSPLIRRTFIHNHRPADIISDSVGGTFYSPVESPEGSDDEGDSNDWPKYITDISSYENGEKSMALLEEVWEILHNDKWTIESTTAQGDKICTQRLPRGEKVFRLEGVVEAPLNLLLEVLYKRMEELPVWSPTVKESKVLLKVNATSDIIYQMSAEVGKGIVSSRDFVMLRCLCEKNNSQVIASVSIPNCLPTKKKIIRGENGPGCWCFKQVAAFETEVRWLLNTNIRGWLPQYAVDSALISTMTDHMSNLRRRLALLRSESIA